MEYGRSRGELSFNVAFPQLNQSPDGYRYGRKVFPVYKNMQSASVLGANSFADIYHSGMLRLLRDKQRNRSCSPARISDSQETIKPPPIAQELITLRSKLREREEELRVLRKFIRQPESSQPSMRSRSVGVKGVPRALSSLELREGKTRNPAFSARRKEGKPMLKVSTPFAQCLADYRPPSLLEPRYTRSRPKLDVYNPITGVRHDYLSAPQHKPTLGHLNPYN